MTPPRDTEAYEAGYLSRSGSGYEWRADAAVMHPAYDAEDLPPGDFYYLRQPTDESGPWLVPSDPLGVSLYRPPLGRKLLHRFASLPDPAAMAAFAGEFGLLGEPVDLQLPDGRWVEGEPLQLWEQEVEVVRELARALHDARNAAQDWRSLKAMAERFSVQTMAGGAQPELVFTYGARSMRVTYVIAGGRHKPAELVDAWRGIKSGDERWQGINSMDKGLKQAAETLAEPVRGCVQWAIETRLQNQHVGIRYRDYRKPGSQPPQIVPSTLLGAIYLELDRRVRTHARPGLSRPSVACAWESCRNWVAPVRKQERYFCGPTCRKRWQRQQDRENPQRVSDRQARLQRGREEAAPLEGMA